MLGILVIGTNHFIVEGPEPDASEARSLARQWSVIRIGNHEQPIPGWTIRTKAYREDLMWAVIVDVGEPASPAVDVLLAELEARGISAKRV